MYKDTKMPNNAFNLAHFIRFDRQIAAHSGGKLTQRWVDTL